MAIIVTSNQPAEQAAKPVGDVVAKSAPEAKEAAEQKEPAESDPAVEKAEVKTGDESEDEESDEDAEAKDSDKEKPKKKSGSQRRKERAERAEAEVARLQKLVEKMAFKGAVDSDEDPNPAAAAKKADPIDGEPKPDQFETHAEYVKAIVKWDREQADKAKVAEEQKSKAQAEQETLIKSYAEREQSFRKETADYDDVLAEVEDVRLSPTVQHLIVSSESGPALAYELAKNREEFERINKLPPLAAAREIGKFESRITPTTEAKKPEPKKTTQAPKPLTPVGSKGAPIQKSPSEMTQAEYEAHRREQIKRRASAW